MPVSGLALTRTTNRLLFHPPSLPVAGPGKVDDLHRHTEKKQKGSTDFPSIARLTLTEWLIFLVQLILVDLI